MKAIICTRYGPPEVLQPMAVPKPAPLANEVLIRIHATTCHFGDVRVPAPSSKRTLMCSRDTSAGTWSST
jgi:NADPH:quinone reductase-like Zn-dependent oxidoreductase